MSRLPSLTFCPAVCPGRRLSDDESGPTDAGQDARRDGSSGCTMADCQASRGPASAAPRPPSPSSPASAPSTSAAPGARSAARPGPTGDAADGRRDRRRDRHRPRRPGRRGSRRAGRPLKGLEPAPLLRGRGGGPEPFRPLVALGRVPWPGLGAVAARRRQQTRTRGAGRAAGAPAGRCGDPASRPRPCPPDPSCPSARHSPWRGSNEASRNSSISAAASASTGRQSSSVVNRPSSSSRLGREVGAPQRQRPLAQGPVGPHLGGEPGQHVRLGQPQGRACGLASADAGEATIPWAATTPNPASNNVRASMA